MSDVDAVLEILRAQSAKVRELNKQPSVQVVVDKTQEFVEEYIKALTSKHFPNVTIPLLPVKHS